MHKIMTTQFKRIEFIYHHLNFILQWVKVICYPAQVQNLRIISWFSCDLGNISIVHQYKPAKCEERISL